MTTPNEHPIPDLWKLGPITAPPDVVLHDWKCFDLTPPGNPATRRFLGRNGQSPAVYTSAPVIKFDPVQGIGEATDGAVLRLTGPAGAETVNIDAYIHDVTDEIEQLLCAQ
jgi:hypothetical protein